MKHDAVMITLLFCGMAFAQNASQPPPGAEPTCRGLPTDPQGCITTPHATYSPKAEYDEESRKAKIEGAVRLEIMVTREGRVKNPKVVKSLSEALDKRAIEAVSLWKFDPATRDGKPVSALIQVDIYFKLE